MNHKMQTRERKSYGEFLLRRTSQSVFLLSIDCQKHSLYTPDFWISAESKILYGLLPDQMSPSVKNGWLDDTARVQHDLNTKQPASAGQKHKKAAPFGARSCAGQNQALGLASGAAGAAGAAAGLAGAAGAAAPAAGLGAAGRGAGLGSGVVRV